MLKDLQEKYDKIAEECRRFKKQCRILAKRLKDAGCKCNNYIRIVRNVLILCCNWSYMNINYLEYKLFYLLIILSAVKDEGEERSYMKGTGESMALTDVIISLN